MIKKILPFILILGMLFLILFRGLQLNPKEVPSARIGKALPHVQVLQMSSKKNVNLEAWYGRPFLIHFWASWCDNCSLEIPILAKYKTLIPIIGVDYKDTPEASNQMMALWGDTFRGVVNDTEGKFAFDLGVVATPETFLIDKQGIVKYRHQGPLTEEIFNQEIWPQLQAMGVKK